MQHEIIMASAGSGKTYRLSNRIITILLDGVDPRKVIALTFTRKAAGEFSAALFEKIADAAMDPQKAAQLCEDIGREGQYGCTDFLALLEKVVEVLPEVYLGTLDSYFTRVIQAFQFELGLSTGSGLQILEGSDLEELKSEVLNDILFTQETSGDFLQAFKQASFGKEEVMVASRMDNFVNDWHRHYLTYGDHAWGNLKVAAGRENLTPWHKQDVTGFIALLDEVFGEKALEKEAVAKSLQELKENLPLFSGGSGKLSTIKLFFENALKIKDALLNGYEATMTFQRIKFTLTPAQSKGIGKIITALCEEELLVKAVQSKALWDVMKEYEAHYDESARQMGRLSFEDLKFLLGKWQHSEEERITRELIDYRLDARHDHWLLDEFQDTSRDQFYGLKPLLDEVGMDQTGDRSLFVVGDVKQSIYQWRGGDPKLFYLVAETYGIQPEDMSRSWRSQEPVLALVNQICGNKDAIKRCFGEADAVERWAWNDHEQASQPKSSYSEVRTFTEDEEKVEYLLDLLRESRPTERGLSCAILTRDNKKVSFYAEKLKEEGFPVAEEGRVNPTMDNPVGTLFLDLIKWMFNPGDAYAKRHLQMSPLGQCWQGLRDDDIAQWKEWNMALFKDGLGKTLARLLAPLEDGLSQFGKERLTYLLEEVRAFTGERGALVRHLENLSVPVAESSRVIQVMTIHQSKGLGFDMVLLPEIANTTAANSGNFSFAQVSTEQGETIMSCPTKDVRSFFHPMQEAEEEWKQEQYYEAFCVLYVALTRSKRGLYVFLPKEPKSMDNFARWIYESLPAGAYEEESMQYASGDERWYDVEEIKRDEGVEKELNVPILPHKRGRAMASEGARRRKAFSDTIALQHGESFHDLMEHLNWLPEIPTEIAESEFSDAAYALVENAETLALLSAPVLEDGDSIRVHKEQLIEWIDGNGLWNTARIDRLHLFLKGEAPSTVQIIDYKTDAITEPSELKERHQEQLERYKGAIKAIYGEAISVSCHLVNLTHGYTVSWE